jgi:L-ribulose-5-phosphate 4-epimerase
MVVVDLDGNVVECERTPSSDTAAHAYMYSHCRDVYREHRRLAA